MHFLEGGGEEHPGKQKRKATATATVTPGHTGQLAPGCTPIFQETSVLWWVAVVEVAGDGTKGQRGRGSRCSGPDTEYPETAQECLKNDNQGTLVHFLCRPVFVNYRQCLSNKVKVPASVGPRQ